MLGPLASGHDLAAELVTHGHRQRGLQKVIARRPGIDMQIRTTDTGGMNPQQHLTCGRRRHVDLVELQSLGGLGFLQGLHERGNACVDMHLRTNRIGSVAALHSYVQH